MNPALQELADTVLWHDSTQHDPRPGWCDEDRKWWKGTVSICSHSDHIGQAVVLGWTAPRPPHAPIMATIGPDCTLVDWRLMWDLDEDA